MTKKIRSNCPVSYALELVGDKWSLLILRDILLRDKKFYQEFVASAEGIATNILSNRLAMLESNGFINKQRDTEDRKRYIYSPTKKGLDLLPVIISIMQWSDKYNSETDIRPPFMDMVRNDPIEFEKFIRGKFLN
ncbi:MAG: helix-turn-helix domain-containing protein [Emcibacteraceae bacterium]